MTKREARAICRCAEKIEAALQDCLLALSGQERAYAENYWAAHIRKSIAGDSYGSMPITRATEAF